MASFFGRFFNYSKPGPGVSRGEPKKSGIRLFFEIYFRKFWKLILTNLLFVVASLPVVTFGLAAAGMTYITRNFSREKHAFLWSDFIQTIKDNWKQALPAGILDIAVTAIFCCDFYFFVGSSEYILLNFGKVVLYLGTALTVALAVIFVFFNYYLFFLMITFRYSFMDLLRNSFLLTIVGIRRNLLITLILGVFVVLSGVLIFALPGLYGLFIVIFLYILFLPALFSLIIQFNIFPVIKQAILDPNEEENPEEIRRAKLLLNMEVSEPESDEEMIFQDDASLPKDSENPSAIPRQYSSQELRRLHVMDEDDDDTI